MRKQKTHQNPYRDGSKYHTMFAYWAKKQVVTRAEFMKNGYTLFDVNIMLSPRISSTRGDCRGNPAAAGNLYYAEPLKKHKQGDEKKFRLRWRSETLSPLRRKNVGKVESYKVATEPETEPEKVKGATTPADPVS